MIRILYVHGYHGNPSSGSFPKLSRYAAEADFGGEEVEMHFYDYDSHDPVGSIAGLRKYHQEHKIDLMLGSSLGAFMVMSCPGVLRVAINPCWLPSVELPKIDYDGPVDGYVHCEAQLGSESTSGDMGLCIGCFAEEDEIFGTKYRPVFEQHFKTAYDIPGGHSLSEDGARWIMTELAPALLGL